MRRGQLVLLALFLCSAVVGAQAPGPPAPVVVRVPPGLSHPTVLARVSHEDVTARMLSFDRNSNGKVEKAELGERMHSLVTRGDVNGDGALDRTEIHALATAPPTHQGGRGGFPFSGSYGFADEIETSSRSHIEGSLDDLRLASPAKEQAQAVVKTFVDTFEKAASDDLLKELEPLLAPSQFIDFKWALGSRNRLRTFTAPVLQTPGARPVVVVRGTGLGTGLDQLIRGYRLEPPQAQQALAAVEQYKTRVRLSDADRAGLVAQLQGILSPDDRESFRAALARRPVVATSPTRIAFESFIQVVGELKSGPVHAVFRGTPVVPTSVRPSDER